MVSRFRDCTNEKNYILIRYDILQGLRSLYDELKGASIKEQALELIEMEEDPKYQKKYRTVWRNVQ
ncbi:hypothetical protein MNQ98_17940 [Paenibacillus sp. N3/727]|uniref:hypothetical protein n=1 Tax=Paenibacillus sp. N3/727 TaxID=2925845 RepID=UPI001F53BED3|nr:hypothetical protein [Paenibacillus sp. N3/727]UNK16393.1 hypothetical protein MNQ98_17940 [Paenibacillus sp. N3/727]